MSSTIKLGSSREFTLLHQYMFYRHLNFTNSKDRFLSTKYLWFLAIQTAQDTQRNSSPYLLFALGNSLALPVVKRILCFRHHQQNPK